MQRYALPNLQIHGRGLSGLPAFRGEGHSRLRRESVPAEASGATIRRHGHGAQRHNLVAGDDADVFAPLGLFQLLGKVGAGFGDCERRHIVYLEPVWRLVNGLTAFCGWT